MKKSYSEEHVGHVLLHSLRVCNTVNRFVDADAFTSENSLVDSEATGGYRE